MGGKTLFSRHFPAQKCLVKTRLPQRSSKANTGRATPTEINIVLGAAPLSAISSCGVRGRAKTLAVVSCSSCRPSGALHQNRQKSPTLRRGPTEPVCSYSWLLTFWRSLTARSAKALTHTSLGSESLLKKVSAAIWPGSTMSRSAHHGSCCFRAWSTKLLWPAERVAQLTEG